jgi:hypothetical protein
MDRIWATVSGRLCPSNSPTSIIRVMQRPTLDEIVLDTFNFSTPPQEAGPVESQAEHLIVQTHGQDKYRRTIGAR